MVELNSLQETCKLNSEPYKRVNHHQQQMDVSVDIIIRALCAINVFLELNFHPKLLWIFMPVREIR